MPSLQPVDRTCSPPPESRFIIVNDAPAATPNPSIRTHFDNLDQLEALIPSLPNVRCEGSQDLLATVFSGDPRTFDLPLTPAAELWEETLNSMMHRAFWGKKRDELEAMVQTGHTGLTVFCQFVRYFTEIRGVDKLLFNERVEGLKQAATSVYVSWNISANKYLLSDLSVLQKI